MRWFLVVAVLIISGCFDKNPKYVWKNYAISYYNSYSTQLLKNNITNARSSYKRAISNAKSSADLTTLKKIYLGSCALNIALFKDKRCNSYKAIRDIDFDQKLDDYYNMILAKKVHDIKNLPKQYQKFYLKKTPQSAFEIEDIVSKAVALSLVRDKTTLQDINQIIKQLSDYGYTNAVLVWLEFAKAKDKNNADYYQRKIDILKDNKR
jgi:hypothetical protein